MPTLAGHDAKTQKAGAEAGGPGIGGQAVLHRVSLFQNNMIHNKQIILITNSFCSATSLSDISVA